MMERHFKTTFKINIHKPDTEGKSRKKTIRWGIKSCLAILLAATVTTTTIYSEVLYAQAETGEAPDSRISFTSFAPFNTVYELGTKGSLDDTLLQLHQQGLSEKLTVTMQSGSAGSDFANLDAAFSPEEDTVFEDILETETPENTPDLDVEDTDSSENTDGSDVETPESTPGTEEVGTDSSENTDGSDVETPENTLGSEEAGRDFSENAGGADVQSSGNVSDSDTTDTDSSEGSTAVLSVTVPDTPVNSAPEEVSAEIVTLENSADPDVSDNDPGNNPKPDEPAAPQSFELDVKWSCDHYEDIRDAYVFTPKWDETAYRYDGKLEDIPKITVIFDEIPGIKQVSSEEQLIEAFENLPIDGSEYRIVLENDISLTDTFNVPVVPADTKVILEGKVIDDNGNTKYCSLTRGSTTFTGAMLNLGTSEASQAAGDVPMLLAVDQNVGGTLTLRNITIDGKKTADISDPSSPDNQVNAPAVIVNGGHLILEEGASIINNYNGGTYQLGEDGAPARHENGKIIYTDLPYGGGIRVCGGTLELKKGCRIQYNKAGLRGGGIYLDAGAVLDCDTDAYAIVGNAVDEKDGGTGADLFACQGSKIYYDPAVFFLWNSFYIVDPDGTLIPDGSSTLDKTTPIEIYLHVGSDSGYSYRKVKEKLESTFGNRVTVLIPQTHIIDTTDLRDWYIYDHYDNGCWDKSIDTDSDGVPDSWEEAYKEYLHRSYYSYTTSHVSNSIYGNDISSWLEHPSIGVTNELLLTRLKEHIYSRAENGRPEMTFVGYDVSPCVDFLFYNPKSAGQKTIEFDVDSSKVNTHTLGGNGFLLNIGIQGGNSLSGYLLYYSYPQYSGTTSMMGSAPSTISLYRFSGVNIDSLHYVDGNSGTGINTIVNSSNLVGKAINIEPEKWNSKMSIKITVDGDEVTVIQHPKDKPEASATFTWKIEDGSFSGFGPLVAYRSHSCALASSFTYSNLRMQFTDPDQEDNLLSSLEEADFSQQDGVKRYFLNLLGESKTLAYTDELGTEFGDMYHQFLYMMQNEGIGLITDAKTPFAQYLGPTNISPNLFEVPNHGTADLNTLIANLETYLSMYNTTELPDDLGGLARANARKPLGNTWLADASTGVQLPRVLNANALPTYYMVNVMDIACDPSGGGYTAKYFLRKPGSSEYEELPPLDGSSENAVAYSSRSGSEGARFVITTNDPVEWPEGQYTIKQTVRQNGDTEDSAICGYSYFTLTRSPLPEVLPAETVASTSSSGGSHSSEPVLAAPEITAPGVVQPTVTSDGASQPKTGDGMFPAIPVACGACTAFMMKIMLWMYDVDFDIVTEHKEEVVRSLILWGKGSAKPRIYIAIVALTAVITAYHLLKAFVANSKQIVRERLGI